MEYLLATKHRGAQDSSNTFEIFQGASFTDDITGPGLHLDLSRSYLKAQWPGDQIS